VNVEGSSPEDIITNNPTIAYDHHIYNLQNRLARLEKYDETHTLTDVVEYKYNDNGIRVAKIDDPDGTPITTDYLIDAYNHTGYAQTLEEDSPAGLKTYTIGDDMLTEAVDSGTAKHLLYDGHGSTRQLVSGTLGSMTIHDDFSYDGYGVLLQQESVASAAPGKVAQQATNLLYAGEHFDTSLQMYYNRARYYDQNIGRFNRMDPFSGNNRDPQSLHKYLYAHCNPIMNVDPSGNSPLVTGLIVFAAVATLLAGITIGLIALRGAMIRGGARGTFAYIDFSGFDLSGIKFAKGNLPDKDIVKKYMLRLMNSEFGKAGVTVAELTSAHKTTLTTPILSFTQQSRFDEQNDGSFIIEWGRERVGDVRPTVHLGNFKTDAFNNKLRNNEQLAFALTFLSIHELGHSYKLPHLNEYGNIMRENVTYGSKGSGAGGQNTVDDIIKGLLRGCSFSENQIEVIKNVALTGKAD